MAVTLTQVESLPASYPAVSGLSAKAAALDGPALWQRIEAHIGFRWTARTVVWTVEGEGEWTPPLSPATVTLAERWTGTAWATVTLTAGPFGVELAADGPYRITATVGGGSPPPAVAEAFRRLAEYVAADDKDHAGLSDYSMNLGGELQESWTRNPAHLGRALINSGAADLLRPYRKVT